MNEETLKLLLRTAILKSHAVFLLFCLIWLACLPLPYPVAWNAVFVSLVTVVVYVGGGVFSLLLHAKPAKRTKRWRLIVSGSAFLVLAIAYLALILNNAPKEGYENLYDYGGMTLLLAASFSLGFLCSEFGTMLVKPDDPKSKH